VTDAPCTVVPVTIGAKDAQCMLVGESGLTEFLVSGPISRLEVARSVTLSRNDKKTTNKLVKDVRAKVIEQLRDGEFGYRLEFRRRQVGRWMKREVSCALKSRMIRRRVSVLGLTSPAEDRELFGADNKTSYQLSDRSLSMFDSLLGTEWDILPCDGNIHFVTRLTMKQSRYGVVSATILTAIARVTLTSLDYRQELWTEVLKCGMPIAENGDEEEDEEEDEELGDVVV
jgi:hypothetical protein